MRISDWSSDVCSSDLLIVRNQHRTRHVTGIKLGLGAYIENQRWMLGLQLLRQLSRQARFAGGNTERAQHRSNNDYRRPHMHDKTFGSSSDERRVGQEGVRTSTTRLQPEQSKNK